MHAAAGFGAAGVLTGQVNLNGNALLEFDSGQIASIASEPAGLYGSNAFVADAGSTASNSALTGLTSNAGDFELQYGAAVNTSGDFSNTGTVSTIPRPTTGPMPRAAVR